MTLFYYFRRECIAVCIDVFFEILFLLILQLRFLSCFSLII